MEKTKLCLDEKKENERRENKKWGRCIEREWKGGFSCDVCCENEDFFSLFWKGKIFNGIENLFSPPTSTYYLSLLFSLSSRQDKLQFSTYLKIARSIISSNILLSIKLSIFTIVMAMVHQG